MKELFQPGNTVRLKSGGPLMTVSENNMSIPMPGEQPEFTGFVTCSWFDGNKRESQSFRQETIELDEEE